MSKERKDQNVQDTISIRSQLMGLDKSLATAHVARVFELDVQLKRRIGEDRFAQIKGLILRLLDEEELSVDETRSMGHNPKLFYKKATHYLNDYKLKTGR